MKPRRREINVFNLSMLDVIAAAMAAFLILVVVLLPYYKKEHVDYQAVNAGLRRSLAEAETRAREAEASAASARSAAEAEARRERERAEALAQRLAKTFVVLFVRWDTHDDIDLHVVDPSGAEFYWDGHRTIPGRRGELSEDTVIGPGAEVWEIREAPPGEYRVHVELYGVKDRRKPVVVRGRVFHRDGSRALREVRLHRAHQREAVAVVTVDAEGDVRVR